MMKKQEYSESTLDASLAIPSNKLTLLEPPLGTGAFGEVFKGTWSHTRVHQKTVAIKRLLEKKIDGNVLEAFKKEVSVQVELDSDYIVKMYGITLEQPYCIVMEYMPLGSLYNYLKNTPRESLSWERRLCMGRDIAGGVAYLHELHPPIIHQDLKSLNVLLGEEGQAKVADFGLSQVKKVASSSSNASQYKVNSAVGSFLWMAPELFERRAQNSASSDVYALGWTLWELAAHQVPFHEDSAKGSEVIIRYIKQGEREEFPKDTPKEYSQIIQTCWAAAPAGRPSAQQVFSSFNSLVVSSGIEQSNQAVTNVVHPNYMLASGAAISQSGASPSYLVNSSVSATPNYLLQSEAAKPIVPPKPAYLLQSQTASPAAVHKTMTKTTPSKQTVGLFASKPPLPLQIPIEKVPGEDEFNKGENYYLSAQYEASLSHYMASAQLNYIPAYFRLWQLYGNFLTPKCPAQEQIWLEKVKSHLQWFESEAKRGNVVAQFNYGLLHYLGGIINKDIGVAVSWYEKAASQGYPAANFALYFHFYKGEASITDKKKALNCCHLAADKGHALAQSRIGYYYREGLSGIVEKNLTESIRWYTLAAERGENSAQCSLGYQYYHGQGVIADKKTAIYWYQKAAAQGNVNALDEMGRCYEYGIVVSVDLREAIQCYRKAVEKGFAPSQVQLGYCYEKGIGVNVDLSQAFSLYEKAAEQGNASGQNNLGVCYRDGVGVKVDIAKAILWLQKAANQGYVSSQLSLGTLYYEGKGLKRDYQEALRLYRLSAEQGNAQAQHNLGVMYEKGQGIKADLPQSIYWYQKSADQGNKDAQWNLNILQSQKGFRK